MRSIAVLLFTVLAGACGSRGAPEPEPTPAAAPVAAARTRPPPPPAEVCRCITHCFVQNGRLRQERVRYSPQTGDTLTMDSLPITQLAPLTGEYASVAGWYVGGEAIRFRGLRFIKYGLPRVLGINEVEAAGTYRGVPVFVESGRRDSVPDVLYLPTRPGCQFQPYTGDTPRG